MKFMRKPVVVDAIQWTGNNVKEMRSFTRSRLFAHETNGVMMASFGFGISIHADPGDWIIQDEEDHYSSCKPDDFKTRYEPVIANRDSIKSVFKTLSGNTR